MDTSENYKWLSHINFPEDLRQVDLVHLPDVCQELRYDIIDELSENPGHFASSLGTVELTVALHYVFNTPYDRLVWDVGHQAYGHKILTGRRDRFHTNRKYKGIKPFPSPTESPYDTFTCGHASNAISAALGMSVAARQSGHQDRHVVAIIGDGAMSGGLAFEGLNNVASTPNNLLIILNDNNMSIDHSVGGLKNYLLKLHTSGWYNKWRQHIGAKMMRAGMLNSGRKERIIRFNNALKSLMSSQQNMFEGLNIRYFGPYDGHNVQQLVKVMREIKDLDGPKILHLHTIKGKGFEPAEKDQTIWHAPGKFDKINGTRILSDKKDTPPLFQDVFGHTLLELAEKNPKIIGVTPAMPTGCSMNIMMRALPSRTFDVGIAEGHAVTFSAGMAKDGLQPFCNIYSSFAQRAYDNIIHDAAILNLPIVLCLDRAGLVGCDGPTHHGVFDIAALRIIPGITIASPYDECELRHLMYTAQLPGRGLFVIRYPRGHAYGTQWQCPMQSIPIGTGRTLKEGTDMAVISLGPIGHTVSRAISLAEATRQAQGQQLSIAHYDLRFVKPLDKQMLDHIASRFTKIITVEDGCIQGGMGSAVLEYITDQGFVPQITRLGIPDYFVEHGTPEELYQSLGLDVEGIKQTLLA